MKTFVVEVAESEDWDWQSLHDYMMDAPTLEEAIRKATHRHGDSLIQVYSIADDTRGGAVE